ncbi:MAG TPA: hypothetical protein DCS42_11980 [Nitrospiraceae bacterium]|nr:hypothetical protein [Nitrospiraceae bacterium]
MKQKKRIDRRQARAWMVMEGIRPQDIQKALGQRFHVQVIETLQGVRNDRNVLNWLIERGCPVEYLQLPKSMQKGEK